MDGFSRGGYYAILNLAAPHGGFWQHLPEREASGEPELLPSSPGGPWPDALVEAQRLLEAQPCCLQVRAKEAPARLVYALGLQLLPLCRAAGVPLCINDRLDVGLALGADFVHLGQHDIPIEAALRARAAAVPVPGAPRLRLGVSTHSLMQAEAAVSAGAEIIGFGPIYPTGSKTNPDPAVGVEMLAEVVRRVPVPVVAIGGITLDNVAAVARAGAHAAAVIGAVKNAPDPVAAGLAIGRAFR